MILCPICDKPTEVVETRSVGAGTRRRRRCSLRSCAGKVTTLEIVAKSRGLTRPGESLVVSRKAVEKLQRDLALIAAGAEL